MFGGFPRSHRKGPQGPRKASPSRPLRQPHVTSPVQSGGKKRILKPLQGPQEVPDEIAVPVVRSVASGDLPKGVWLSILVKVSGPDSCGQLLSDLEAQLVVLSNPPVEVLIQDESEACRADVAMTKLLMEATGHFVVFLCEGDEISGDYVSSLLGAIRRDPWVDCIGMKGLWTSGMAATRSVLYSVRNRGNYEAGGVHLKPPGHSTPIRRDIATRYNFFDTGIAVEVDWSLRILGDLAILKEAFVDKILHHHLDPSGPSGDPKHESLKISCILTSYNRPTFLRQALRSLESQTHKNFELLLFDDSSKMDVRPILDEFDLPVSQLVVSKVTPKERGSVNRLSLNINKGLALATGDLVCFLADDDYYYPRWFEGAASFFCENKKVSVGYGRLTYSRSREMEFRAIGQFRWPGGVVTDPFEQVDHNQVMHRRFKVPYKWPEEFSTVTAPDGAYFKTLSNKHPFHPIDANAAVKRLHEKNIQNTAAHLALGNFENIRE